MCSGLKKIIPEFLDPRRESWNAGLWTLVAGLWTLEASQTRLWILGIGSRSLDDKTLGF